MVINNMIFILALLVFLFFYNFKTSLSRSIIVTLLQFSVAIVFITESLSIFESLNLKGIFIYWSLVLIFCLIFTIYNRKMFYTKLNEFYRILRKNFKNFNLTEKILLFSILMVLSSIFLQGVLYPPNNWDSLTYHLTRIMYWISNNSLDHFQTNILRNLYQPPFSEYIILHVNFLSGNDSFSNSVQWFFLIGSSAIVWQLLTYFKISKTIKLLSVIFLITIPSVALQASTTKNDIISGFFILSSLLYFIKIYHNPKWNYFVFLGISIGAGVLTKGTFYLYVFPIILLFVFLYLKTGFLKKSKNIIYTLLAISIAIMINTGHFSRNYQLNGNIISIDQAESEAYSNKEFSMKIFTSNLLKNIGLHVNYPFIEEYDSFNKMIHKKINVNLEDNQLNYLSIKYNPPQIKSTHEDGVSNFLHLVLIFGMFLTFLIKTQNNKNIVLLRYISVALILQLILFCLVIKWQPWHTRLHIPIFMLSSVVVFIWIDFIKKKLILVYIFLLLLILNTSFFIIYNNLRPFKIDFEYTKSINIGDSNYKKYFSNQLHLHQEYQAITFKIKEKEKIGLIMNDWEYPLLVYNYYEPIKILTIQTSNITSKIPQNEENLTGIISNTINKEFIIHNNKKYINESKNNNFIWIYR